MYIYNTPRYVRVTSSHVKRQQIKKHKQLKLTSDESSWCTPFSLKLWGTVSGLFAGELMFQFGFSSTRQKRSETWGWERKRVGKKNNGREFSIPHKKLFEETQPSHTLKRDAAENGYLACDMFHASERNEQDLFVVNKRTSCESERALRFCWVV